MRFACSHASRGVPRPSRVRRPRPREDAGPGDAAWPEREVWVFAANERLRQVELSGPPAIDPSRTELPSEWTTLPAFLLEPGATLSLRTARRGQPEAGPDAVTLFREIWLDSDGRSASVRDTFGGRLQGTTRLDLLAPGALGRVAVDGQDQLVTAHSDAETSGVELRRAALRLEADSRVRPRRRSPGSGLVDGRRAAPGATAPPARLEHPRLARRRRPAGHLDVALDPSRLLLRPPRGLRGVPALRRARTRPSRP